MQSSLAPLTLIYMSILVAVVTLAGTSTAHAGKSTTTATTAAAANSSSTPGTPTSVRGTLAINASNLTARLRGLSFGSAHESRQDTTSTTTTLATSAHNITDTKQQSQQQHQQSRSHAGTPRHVRNKAGGYDENVASASKSGDTLAATNIASTVAKVQPIDDSYTVVVRYLAWKLADGTCVTGYLNRGAVWRDNEVPMVGGKYASVLQANAQHAHQLQQQQMSKLHGHELSLKQKKWAMCNPTLY